MQEIHWLMAVTLLLLVAAGTAIWWHRRSREQERAEAEADKLPASDTEELLVLTTQLRKLMQESLDLVQAQNERLTERLKK